jgi:hypothetical protein
VQGACAEQIYTKNQKISGIDMSLKLLVDDQGFGIQDENNFDPGD